MIRCRLTSRRFVILVFAALPLLLGNICTPPDGDGSGDPAPLSVDAGPDRTVRAGDTVTFDMACSGPRGSDYSFTLLVDLVAPELWSSWEWISGADFSTDGRAYAAVRFLDGARGPYPFRLSITAGDGRSVSDDVIVTVTGSTDLAVDAGPDQSVNPGDTVVLAASTTGFVLSVSYVWHEASPGTSGSATLAGANTPVPQVSFSNDAEGTWVFEVTVTDANGNRASDTVKVHVTLSSTTYSIDYIVFDDLSSPIYGVMAGSDGHGMAPTVERDASGNVTKVTGFVYRLPDGGQWSLFLGDDGMPATLVAGGLVIEFRNYRPGLADLVLHAPDGSSKVIEDAPIDETYAAYLRDYASQGLVGCSSAKARTVATEAPTDGKGLASAARMTEASQWRVAQWTFGTIGCIGSIVGLAATGWTGIGAVGFGAMALLSCGGTAASIANEVWDNEALEIATMAIDTFSCATAPITTPTTGIPWGYASCMALAADLAVTHAENQEAANQALSLSCGDGECSGDETCVSCPTDCGSCPGDERILLREGRASHFYGAEEWSNMTALLDNVSSSGITVVSDLTDSQQVLSFDALWVDVGPWAGDLGSAELENIKALVETGRRVVLVGENRLWAGWNNQILGIVNSHHCGGDDNHGVARSVIGHPLTSSASSLKYQAIGCACEGTALYAPNFVTLWGSELNVLTILDSNVLDDENWDNEDNAQFAQNVANWILKK